MLEESYISFGAFIKKTNRNKEYEVYLVIVDTKDNFTDENEYKDTSYDILKTKKVARFMVNNSNKVYIIDSLLSIPYDKLLEHNYKTKCDLLLNDETEKIKQGLGHIKEIIVNEITENITNDDGSKIYSRGYLKKEVLLQLQDDSFYLSLDDALVIPSIDYVKEIMGQGVLEEKPKFPVYEI